MIIRVQGCWECPCVSGRIGRTYCRLESLINIKAGTKADPMYVGAVPGAPAPKECPITRSVSFPVTLVNKPLDFEAPKPIATDDLATRLRARRGDPPFEVKTVDIPVELKPVHVSDEEWESAGAPQSVLCSGCANYVWDCKCEP